MSSFEPKFPAIHELTVKDGDEVVAHYTRLDLDVECLALAFEDVTGWDFGLPQENFVDLAIAYSKRVREKAALTP